MLRRTETALLPWRVRYHRSRLPRAHALRQHKEKLAGDKAKAAAAAAATGSQQKLAMGQPAPATELLPGFGATEMETQTYKYNRHFVNHELQFIAQEHVVEDPRVIHRRKTQLEVAGSGGKDGADAEAAASTGTPEKVWKTPHQPWMDPMLPFIRVLDFPKDPDVKYLKPTNIPRWKDFMTRSKPMTPRTWY